MADGSIAKRGDRYRARYRNPDSGRQYERTFTRKGDAKRWLTAALGDLERGRWVDPSAGRVSFGDFYESYATRQTWATGTIRAMDLAAKSTTFWDTPIGRIRASHLDAWVKAMTVGHGYDKPLAASTIRTRVSNVRSVFRAAVADEILAVDPSAKMAKPKGRARLRKAEAAMSIPTPHEVGAILAAADDRFMAFVAVCAFAGLRLGEAAALQEGDVDFLRRRLSVQRQVQRKAGGEVEITPPKYGSERVVPIGQDLLEILAQHLELGHRGEWLFQGSRDLPPHQNTVGHQWRSTLRRAGISGVRLHDLRHFYASGLIAAGCDVVTVQKALGHSKATTTLNTYSHLWPSAEDKTRDAAATLAASVLRPNVGGMRAGGDS